MKKPQKTSGKVPRLRVAILDLSIPMPFMSYRGSRNAMIILSLASQLRVTCGGNLYELMSTDDLAHQLHISPAKVYRAKRELRDRGLLDLDGHPGDYSEFIQFYEQATGEKWQYPL